MAKEIERKFLIANLDACRRDVRSPTKFERLRVNAKQTFIPLRIKQGYLSFDPVVRVRISDIGAFETKCFMTIKGNGLKVRDEFEYEIPLPDARKLLKMCKGIINKTRYSLGRWEIDEFHGKRKGLWLAEIELKSSDEKLPPLPKWLGEEVTEDPRYANVNMARY